MTSIDIIDKKIILSLFKNGRISLTQLGKDCRISKEVANYRLKKLFQNKIIDKIVPIIDFSSLGYTIYRLQIKLNPITDNQENQLIKYITSLKNINWVDEILGKWDLVMIIYVKNNKEFYNIYNNILDKYGHFIAEKNFSILNKIKYYSPNYLLKTQDFLREEIVCGDNVGDVELEENAKLILNELYLDGRKSLVEIGKNLGVSISTVKYHLKYLKENKILLGFQPVLNIEKIGYEHFKVVMSFENPSIRKEIEQELIINENVVHITSSIGLYDLEFEAEFEKVTHLLKLIEKLKKTYKIKNFEIIYDNEEFLISNLSLKFLCE